MKLQPTCAICLRKIKIIDIRLTGRTGPGLKLLCKHVFHEACIKSLHRPQCPLCEHPIFTKDENKLISMTNEDDISKVLKNVNDYDINVKNILMFLIQNENERLLNLMFKYCDFTEFLAANLNNKELVKQIVLRGRVNWFKTFRGGLTFLDLANETNDFETISLINNILPLPQHAQAQLRKEPFIRTHKRSNSFATVRNSFRISTVPVIEEESDSFQEYPIIENMYPVLPSAPAFEDWPHHL
jgi:hypothetical protein